MTSFRTVFSVKDSSVKLSYADRSYFIGSCFSNSIGKKMEGLQFRTIVNPFGTIYNPISISSLLRRNLDFNLFSESELNETTDLFFSYETHSKASSSTSEKCLEYLNKRVTEGSDFLKKGNFLFITLGTAWVYELKETNRIVANCHKMPSSYFNKRLLSVEEIVKNLNQLFMDIECINSQLNVVFTLSPVRHLRDGFIENQQSKSVLYLAIQKLTETFPFVSYFPAYEIMMDDLRDYRFYKEDMIHPNSEAIQYIWESFRHAYVSKETYSIMTEIEKVQRAVDHRPFNSSSPQHQSFIRGQLGLIDQIESEHTFMDFSAIKEKFVSQLV